MPRHEENIQLLAAEDILEGVIQRFGGTPAEALTALMEILASAGDLHAQQPSERNGAKLALHAMAWFTRSQGNSLASALFDKLACCLVDLDNGMADDLIKPIIYGNRPPDPIRKKMFLALALECVRRLCSLEQLAVGEARKIVAGWLNDIPGFSDRRCTEQTLKNWQQKYKDEPEHIRLRQLLEVTLRQAKLRRDVRRALDELGKAHLK